MDKTLRTAATGLSGQQRYVEIISNNMANINTTAFKKVRPEFEDLIYENIKPAGGNRRYNVEPLNEVQIGTGTELADTKKIFSQGDITETNNQLDLAVKGDGFFIVRKPDNSYAYTRDGSFRVDRNGEIVNSQGYYLEPGFNVPRDALELHVSRDGVVSVLLEGAMEEQTLGQLELARFINSGGLRAEGNNLFVETPASGQAFFEQPGLNNTGELIQYALESSNVDIVEEMVNMIVAQRAYEMNSKAVRTADQILGVASNLKR